MLDFLYAVYQTALVFPLLLIAHFIWTKYTPYDDSRAILDLKLSAGGLVYAGYLLGIFIMMILVVAGDSHGWIDDTITMVSVFLIATASLLLGFEVSARLIAVQLGESRESIFKSIENDNLAIALYQFFIFVSMSILLVITNFGKNLLFADWTSLSLPLFGFGLLVVFILSAIQQSTTSYNEAKALKNGNVAVAISFGGTLLAVTILVANVLAQVQIFNLESIMLIAVYSTISFMFILFVPDMLTKILLQKSMQANGFKTIDEMIGQGNIDVSIVQSVVKLIFAIVAFFSVPFHLV